MQLFSLAYRSRNLIEDRYLDSLNEVQKLLDVSRQRNAKAGVTGALIFNEGMFAQILEGGEAQVRDIFESIKRDPRHTNIVVLPLKQYEKRRFESWSMAFVGPSPDAQNYYERFSLTNGFEWTRASADTLVDLVLDLVAMQDGSAGLRRLH